MKFYKVPNNAVILTADSLSAILWCREHLEGGWKLRIVPSLREDEDVREMIVFDDPDDFMHFTLRWKEREPE